MIGRFIPVKSEGSELGVGGTPEIQPIGATEVNTDNSIKPFPEYKRHSV